jgi:hypothetical protein
MRTVRAKFSLWRGQLEQVYFSARRENEVDFYHAKTTTFLCADAMLNLVSPVACSVGTWAMA